MKSAKKWERSLSLRITFLLVIATLLLIGQSLYNLSSIQDVDESIEVVNKAAFNLDNLSRKIKTPIADVRILSMEMVSAPNRKSVNEIKERYDLLVNELDQKLIKWKAIVESASAEETELRDAYLNILNSWATYKEAVSRTFYYINTGVRIAAFISVTGQEKENYAQLQKALDIFGQMLLQRSRDVFVEADEQSNFAFYSLIITSVIQVLILTVTLFFVFRMFKNYMRASQAYEKKIEAKEAQLSAALTGMSDGLYTVDKDLHFTLFNDRFTSMTGIDKSNFELGKPLEETLMVAANIGSLGEGEIQDLVETRIQRIKENGFKEWESTTHQGRVLSSRKNDMPDGGAIIVVSDVTERRNAETKLKEAFLNISNSILYASKIQQSILPNREFLIEAFEDHFIFWEPRDVVGGDVYWFYEWGDGVLMSLGDCTGHGVPGAFMTLISTGALERAISEVEIGDISSLIGKMNQLLQQSLGQDNGEGLADDGLELGVCYIEPKKNKLSFVGAKFDLLIVENGEVKTIKGGRRGLGYREIPADYVYENIEISASPTAQYYLTTDGALDQKSSKTKRRLGKKGFQELLLKVHALPMKDQVKEIQEALMEHQGDALRRDDVAIIGFKIGRA
ncbi:PAS-domain containing protein [Candidatus Terasakiella magnetica]|uniref:PAS-domain containing protein n=1 Tax=Candidatus Terasakiella magnetica TaxID=1867952 RepID=UPI0013F4C13D|nr:PAS-domain containing protein [Candidatus Terasakiella magnetica]